MRAGLSFADWQNLAPAAAAREVHRRVAALPAPLRRAAIAWLAPEEKLAAELTAAAGVGASSPCAALRGVPYFLKDLFDLAGAPTWAGSSFLEEVRPGPHADSAMFRRLRSAGAVAAGKTHLVEFASGLTGENLHHGDCPHPHFPDRLTGGSSSGSAALVAAGVVPFAVGSDTGGSIRVPASFCGLFGLRLTPGDELIRDAFPLSATCDTAGWLAAQAADLRMLWQFATGGAAPAARPWRGCHLRMADLVEGYDPAAAAACDRASAALCPAADDATRAQLLADWREARSAYATLVMREAWEVHRPWMTSHRERYDPVIWGRYAEAGAWPAEKIAAAHRAKDALRYAWRQFFSAYDYVVLPAVPGGAPRKVDCTPEFRSRILTLTAPASVGGLPTLSIPVAMPSGLTAGLQVVTSDAANGVFDALLRAAGPAKLTA